MPNLGRVVCAYSMSWELDEAGGLALIVVIPETPCMSEWGEENGD